MVVFIMIVIFIFTMMVDLATNMWAMKDLQQKIDNAGINALYSSIDISYLKDEILAVNNSGGGIALDGTGKDSVNNSTYKPIIDSAYQQELSKVKFNGANPNIESTRVKFDWTDYGLGYDSSTQTSAKKRPQIILESMVSYLVPASDLVDKRTGNETKRVTSTSSGEYSIVIHETANDGMRKVVIYSNTRIVLK